MKVSEWTQYFQSTMLGPRGSPWGNEIRCRPACLRPFKVFTYERRQLCSRRNSRFRITYRFRPTRKWSKRHKSRNIGDVFLSSLGLCFVEVRHWTKEGDKKLTFSLNNGIDRLLHICHLFHLISLYIFSSSWEAGASVREENAGVYQ